MPLKCKREDNKERKSAYDKAYYESNKEKVLARCKAYYAANREKMIAQGKVWKQNNKDRLKGYHTSYREANRKKINETIKAWSKANRHKRSAYHAKRRSLKIKQIPIHLLGCSVEKERINQTYKLRDLFTKITGIIHHVDHMWPLSDGGPHWSGNLQIITAEENLRKQAKIDSNIKATIQDMLIEEEQMRYDQY
tara:strand:+ start:1066 stop:1647 length:582 start_codon:yes stop_codon:yes gene_type:complete